MKKYLFLLVIVCAGVVTSCNNADKSAQSTADSLSKQPVPPPADNNSANNPSLADTAYGKKDSTKMKAKP